MTRPLPPNWRPLPGGSRKEPRRVGEGLDSLARRLGMPSAEALGTVFTRWAEIVGPAIAAHAQPVSLTDHVLHIAVDEPGWATQIRFLGAELVTRLEAVVGEGVVVSVDVRVRRQKGRSDGRS